MESKALLLDIIPTLDDSDLRIRLMRLEKTVKILRFVVGSLERDIHMIEKKIDGDMKR